MSTAHAPVPVSAFQLRLKGWCIWAENQFDQRIGRGSFSVKILGAVLLWAAVGWGLSQLPAGTHWLLPLLIMAAAAVIAVWVLVQIVRRLHDLGRSGGLFWALAIPYWAMWQMWSYFPPLWWLWLLLCAWPIWLTLQLFLKPGQAPASESPPAP